MKKSDIAQAYEKYLGPKCSRTTFYKKIREGCDILEAIKPIPHEKRYSTGLIKTKKFADELKWRQEQEGEKSTRSRFYQRLYQGWSKEDAIKLVLPIRYGRTKAVTKQPYIRQKIPTPKVEIEDYKDIRVRYNKDEAWVFIKEYQKMINDLQEQYQSTDDVIESREINNKLEKLVKEYQIFLECQSPIKDNSQVA